MDTPIKAKPAADLRDYLAEERTFLGWIRTGIALMGFEFVVARFGIFLEQLHLPQQFSAAQPHEFSPWFGAANNIGDSNRSGSASVACRRRLCRTGQVSSRCLFLATSRTSQLAGFATPHAR